MVEAMPLRRRLIACRDGRTEIVRAALAAGADLQALNRHGSIAVFGPSHRGHLDNLGWTALQHAQRRGQAEVARLLRAAGARR